MTLLEKLIDETQILKDEFLTRTAEYANEKYTQCEKRIKFTDALWCKFLGVTPEGRHVGTPRVSIGFPKGFFNSPKSRVYDKLKNEAYKITNMGLTKFLQNEKISAELHYQASMEKLAARIKAKRLDESKIEMITSRVGMNIETMISDGSKTVRAWTIIASGEIQKPHYRYLVK